MAEQKLEFDRLRREFAQRVNELIEAESGEKKLETFSKRVGIAMRQLSQWRNPRHINWPSVQNIYQFAVGADVSPTWLLFGKGQKQLEIEKNDERRRPTYAD